MLIIIDKQTNYIFSHYKSIVVIIERQESLSHSWEFTSYFPFNSIICVVFFPRVEKQLTIGCLTRLSYSHLRKILQERIARINESYSFKGIEWDFLCVFFSQKFELKGEPFFNFEWWIACFLHWMLSDKSVNWNGSLSFEIELCECLSIIMSLLSQLFYKYAWARSWALCEYPPLCWMFLFHLKEKQAFFPWPWVSWYKE